MKKALVLILALAMLLGLTAAASAANIPGNVSELEVPELPALPVMHTHNDGRTVTVTLSEPVDWMNAIYCDGHDWTWNDVTWSSPEHTEATVDMTVHAMSPGYGFWSGSGFYEMDYAYDVVLRDGTNVKYKQDGKPALVTITTAGTQYFGTTPSIGTTVVYKYMTDSAGRFVPYVDEIREDYRTGASIHARFAMNGEPTWMYQVNPDGSRVTLYTKPADEPAGEGEQGGQGEEGGDPERASHCINWWIDWNTPDSEIEVPENGFIKYIQRIVVNHGEDVAVVTKAELESGKYSDGTSLPEYSWTWEESEERVHLQVEVLDTPAEGIPADEYDPANYPEWYGHSELNHKEVWVYDD